MERGARIRDLSSGMVRSGHIG